MNMQLVFPVLLVGVFYFFLIMPQQKEKKKLQAMINALKKGDKILTSSGIYGEVHEVIDTDKLSVKISPDVKIEITKNSVSKLL